MDNKPTKPAMTAYIRLIPSKSNVIGQKRVQDGELDYLAQHLSTSNNGSDESPMPPIEKRVKTTPQVSGEVGQKVVQSSDHEREKSGERIKVLEGKLAATKKIHKTMDEKLGGGNQMGDGYAMALTTAKSGLETLISIVESKLAVARGSTS